MLVIARFCMWSLGHPVRFYCRKKVGYFFLGGGVEARVFVESSKARKMMN